MPPSSLRVVYAFAREMYPKNSDVFIQYGTAGFRTKANLLEHVVYRMGLLAVIRSRVKNGRTVGMMITASHNLEPDNGVKLVDPDGEMLEESWEEIATRLANVSDNDLESTTAEIIKQVNADMSLKASVFIGMDTRYTSPRLAAAAANGVIALKGTPKEFGIVTTPMLHFFVKCRNDNRYGTPTEEGYYDKIVGAFKAFCQKLPVFGDYNTTLYVDGANGVGGKKLNIIKKSLDGELDLHLFNLGGNGGKLNLNCGADFVKVSQSPPAGAELAPLQRAAALDGDGDRIVYYYIDHNNEMQLLDGDRIATLLAGYIAELLRACGASHINIGLVQTAYANGASTKYITEHLKVPVSCVKTGVKHLHRAAQAFDIGVYFEANGHGTVLYSDRAHADIRSIARDGDPEQRAAAQLLCHVADMTNQTVGDAVSDLLLAEAALRARGLHVARWARAYRDLPCRQLKLLVEDRNVISTTDAERKCTSPEGLQTKIDELVAKYNSGRAFVRPSGTEDIVRVYAEADTRTAADTLAAEVAQAVFDLAGGRGERPVLPA
ncbi:phosphoacetylglucosamine mutase isoform X2 [Plodia interpunctella]|uniref:phosphoacetylglucosamine mutase isoform X2 n=1 Tax=Plodia interpunctella TaxID=58824 RepID=UPI0023683EE8|nr:phosphoacetylglucosamine mutase isoform X2 [Plodia interpunctella]